MLCVKTFVAASPIHGLGLFADEFIPKGATIWEFTPDFDLHLEAKDLEKLPGPARVQMLKYCYRDAESGDYILCADDARFLNHADEPNTYDEPGPEGITIATRDIAPGEEITGDYRTFDADFREKLCRE